MAKKEFPGTVHSVDVEIGGQNWTFETGYIAKLAAGSVLVKAGGTVVMANVTYGAPQDGVDFFPLTVDYVEKMYAGGLISSSRFIKRENRPSTDETLTARLIDRGLRPLFPKGFINPVQVVVTVLSYDKEFDPKVLAINAASAALSISGLPFNGPIAGLRVGLTDGNLNIYTKNVEIEWQDMDTDLNLVFSAKKEGITMFDADAEIVPEEKIIEGMRFGHEESLKLIEAQEKLVKMVNPRPIEYTVALPEEAMLDAIKEKFGKEIEESVMRGEMEGFDDKTNDQILQSIFAEFEGKWTKSAMAEGVGMLRKKAVASTVIKTGKRIDGRALDEIRPIDIQLGVLPRTHGSAVFTRGDTQALTITTLGSLRLGQMLESIGGEDTKRYMHHYNMPPYATGEAGRFQLFPGRREVGHGALAEKALQPVIPEEKDFPYAIRVVSEITQSNGSSSMASTCGSTLSLMDAGVPIKAPVSGIAMGLIYDEEKDEYHVLSDILGMEDFGGEMDFKITGTRDGVTGIQLDNKREYVPLDVLADAMDKAKVGRLKILDIMEKAMPAPREKMSDFAPRIDTLKIKVDKIGELIGPGGKNIKAIIEDTGAEVNIDDDGTVSIASPTEESRQAAIARVLEISAEPEIGKVYKGKVEKIMDFGAFVSLPGKNSGLVHVSELADEYVKNVRDFVKEGQEVEVVLFEITPEGKYNLSMKRVGKNTADKGGSKEGGKPEAGTAKKGKPSKPAKKSNEEDDNFVGEPGE